MTKPGIRHHFLAITAVLIALISMAETLHAQYFAFGKNRVQYTEFNWRFIQSDHFDVYYSGADYYYLAEFAAYSLEAAYEQIKRDFRHEIADRIQVIIYASHSEFSETNTVPLPLDAQGIGGVTDKFKNRITMPFQGDYSEFRRILHHELIHAVINDMYYGGTIQSIIQNNIQLVFPLWFEEGLSEYMALGWDTNTDMFIRDAVMNGYLPPIPQLQGYFAYRGGQAMWYYIVEEYGREKIGEIMQRIKTTRSVEAGMRQSLGLNLQELSERWHEWLKKRYWPEITLRESLRDVSTPITRREISGSYNTSPAITPQGDRIAIITNRRGFFDVVVINSVDGRVLKTLIRGEDNVDFEELNILRPNLSWSPDGRQLLLSTRSGGQNDITIVEYETGNTRKIKFPALNSIGSVAWSPDGSKIAFDATDGPLSDIYVYKLETQELFNLTSDIFSDREPAWGADSEFVYFVSDRGNLTRVNTYRQNFNMLLNPSLDQTDIFRIRVGDSHAERITRSEGWSEMRPQLTRDNKLFFISDQNGIPNIYVMDLNTRSSQPLTDLVSGVMQMSVSQDGTRMAFNSINRGFLDIFLMQNPLNRAKSEPLIPNLWAEKREFVRSYEMVPALRFGRELVAQDLSDFGRAQDDHTSINTVATLLEQLREPEPEPEPEPERITETSRIDFRNYVFADLTDPATGESLAINLFQPRDTRTEDGRFIPNKYRLTFSPDFTYASGNLATGYGVFALTQILFSDLLGDHQIGFASNLVFDLRNSDYVLSYGYFKNRTNLLLNYFHTSRNFQSFTGEIVRFRYYGGGISFQRPFNKFERLDYGASFITISRDFSSILNSDRSNEKGYFLYPQVTFTRDVTRPGFLTPSGGQRFAISLTGSPPITSDVLQFASIMADARQYIGFGGGWYSLAFRASGGLSFGRDTQNFYLGGIDNWINYAWSGGNLPIDRLEDVFFTLPAIPMRGHLYNSVFGDKFVLLNAEFRYPLIAALLPGPIPLIPLYNITGNFFLDAGTAWQGLENQDILLGTGLGLRTILLGMPFRWDVGWPYNSDGFGRRVHYFSLGIDF
jgi:Tol biopolymer transport system component